MAQIIVSAQNIDVKPKINNDNKHHPLAYTGITTAEQVAEIGATGVVISRPPEGPDDNAREKLLAALETGSNGQALLPHATLILGESWETNKYNSPSYIVKTMAGDLKSILTGTPASILAKGAKANISGDFSQCVIGYQPKWGSYGCGHEQHLPRTSIMVAVSKELRGALQELFGESEGLAVPLICGGGITTDHPKRLRNIVTNPYVDGIILEPTCSVDDAMKIARVMQDAKPDGKKILLANFQGFKPPNAHKDYINAFRELNDDFQIRIAPSTIHVGTVVSLVQ